MMAVPHAVVWILSFVLVWAAVIDGWKLKVPNWLTFSLILSGWLYSTCTHGVAGLGWSLLGTAVGLGLLLPLYAIGGMGAGDVKLLAGIGAWMGPVVTFWAFAATTVIGAMLALVMIAWSGDFIRHWVQFQAIIHEIVTVRNPEKLAAIAAERKPRMKLLPYGIPMTIGSIAYFAYAGMMF